LPFLPQRAVVLDGSGGWRDQLPHTGVEIVSSPPADLAVGPAGATGAAAAARTPAIILEGRTRASVPGYATRRFVLLPSLEDPFLVIPLDRQRVAAYALKTWLFPTSLAGAARRWLGVRLPGPALTLSRRAQIAVLTRGAAQPLLVAEAAKRFDFGPQPDWFVVCGQGDVLARGLFVVFGAGQRQPEWIVKFARVPDYSEPFERDEAALSMVARVGGAASAHAPRLLGRFTVAGHHAAVETAAAGSRLSGVLQSRAPRAEKLRVLEAVAAWIVQVGVETSGGRASAAVEVARLRAETIPTRGDVDPGISDRLDQLPAVLQHNDLGGWNVVVDRAAGFTAVDWESARSQGLPLWDLWYFLAHTLVQLDGFDGDPVDGFRRLFRGEAPSSALLFRWTREAAQALDLPAETLGPLATLCWLHHSRSGGARAVALEGRGGEAKSWPAARFIDVWLADPALGPSWSRWQR
jgi:hypothetical protein